MCSLCYVVSVIIIWNYITVQNAGPNSFPRTFLPTLFWFSIHPHWIKNLMKLALNDLLIIQYLADVFLLLLPRSDLSIIGVNGKIFRVFTALKYPDFFTSVVCWDSADIYLLSRQQNLSSLCAFPQFPAVSKSVP